MQSGKGGLWAVVLILAAAGVWYFWNANNLAIKEPPIDEQIKIQADAMRSGASVSLPIQVVIGKNRINSLEMAFIEGALRSNGFTQDALPEMGELEKTRRGASIESRIYSHYSDSVGVFVMSMDIGGGNIQSISFVDYDTFDGGLGYEDGGYFPGPDVEKKRNKPFKAGVGPLQLGMTEKKVRKAISKVPHDSVMTFKDVLNQPGLLKDLPRDSVAGLTSLMSHLDENNTTLSRGRFKYTFSFSSGKLSQITIMDLGNVGVEAGLAAEFVASMLPMMFDEPLE